MSKHPTTNNERMATKMHCTFCKNAGKADFETHFLRASTEPGAKVTCPVLLATACRYCKEPGHTKNYCPKLAAKAAATKRQQAPRKEVVVDREGFVTQKQPLRRTCDDEPEFAQFLHQNPSAPTQPPQAGHRATPQQKVVTCRFAALKVEDDSDVESQDSATQTCEEDFPELPSLSTVKWGQTTMAAGAWGEAE